MLPIGNLVNQVFWNTISWDVYNQRFSASIPVDRVTGANQTQIGYWSDSQLWQTIAWSRFAYERNPLVKGVINILIDHIGKPSVTWLGERKCVGMVQRLWDRFTTVNCLGESGYLSTSEIAQDREKEMRIRWLRDGEVFLRFFVVDHGFPLRVRFIEPEQIRTPPVAQDEKFSHTWGIVTEKDDNEHIVGYWAFYPQSGDWDFVPRRYVVYGRRNADRNVKRGLPEIANLELDFAHVWSLLRSVAITSKTQASIAWIEKFPGALAEQIISSSTSLRGPETNNLGPMLPGRPNPSPSFYGIDPNAKNIDAGTILATNQGKEYEPGPTSEPGKFLEACSTLLHLLSLQWCLPDWITKGPEAYASALVNGSPFARRIESLQEDYAAVYGQVAMSFLRLMVRVGKLPKDVLRKVRPSVRLPKVIVADEQKQVDLLQKELEAGLLSEIEYLQSRGRNPKKTLAQRRQWKRLLSEYGLENPQAGEQPQSESSRSDEPHPPGSRILGEMREELEEKHCQKKLFHVRDRKNQCKTVMRCSDWKPTEKSSYQIDDSCKPDMSATEDSQKEWQETRGKAIQHWDYVKQEIRKIVNHIQTNPNMHANELAKCSSKLGALGTQAFITSQLSLLLEKANNTSCQAKDLYAGALHLLVAEMHQVIEGREMSEHPRNLQELGAAVGKIITKLSKVSSDKKLGKLGEKLVARVMNSVAEVIKQSPGEGGSKRAIQLEQDNPWKDVLGPHQFVGEHGYFEKLITLSALTNAPTHEDVAFRDAIVAPLLKKLANKAPYDVAASGAIDQNVKQFVFANFVNVPEKVYTEILSKLSKLVGMEVNQDKAQKVAECLGSVLRSIIKNVPNVYGSTESNEEMIAKFDKAIEDAKNSQDVQKLQQLRDITLALCQRCLLAYGTADIARRVHEEKWAEYTKGELAANAEFPIADLTTMKLEGNQITFFPISLKMHLSPSSDSFGKVSEDIKAFVENKMKQTDWKENVINDIKTSLDNVAGLQDASQMVKELRNQACKRYPNDCTDNVNWNNANVAKKCFNAEMVRMCLMALARQLEDAVRRNDTTQANAIVKAIKDKSINVCNFSIVRLRGEQIEWRRDHSKGYTQKIPVERNREKAIESSWEQWITAPGEVSTTGQKAQKGTGNVDPKLGNQGHHHSENSGSNETHSQAQ